MSGLEIFAVIISVIGVALTIKRNMWCWWFNFLAFVLYAYLFYTFKLYGETILQFFAKMDGELHNQPCNEGIT